MTARPPKKTKGGTRIVSLAADFLQNAGLDLGTAFRRFHLIHARVERIEHLLLGSRGDIFDNVIYEVGDFILLRQAQEPSIDLLFLRVVRHISFGE